METRRRRGILAAMTMAALAGAGGAWARQQGKAERAGEKVGQAIDDAAGAVKRGAARASAAVRDRFARVRTSVHDMNVEARVYGRLHWDRALTAAPIEVEVQQGGAAILRGAVPDAAARAKAVALAADTVGVTRVVDQLRIAPTVPAPAPPGR